MLGLLLFHLTTQIIWRAIRRLWLYYTHNDKQTAFYFRELLKLADYYQYPRAEGETLADYGKRLHWRFGFKNNSVFLSDLIDIYYRARFAEYPVTQAETALMRNSYYEMIDMLRKTCNWYTFMYIRYIRRVIRM
jgi:hypothetical protein